MLEILNRNKDNRTCKIISPISGDVISLNDVPDQVFSNRIVGDGTAIEPFDGLVLSPCNGKIEQIFRTNHAIVIKSDEGLQILIHLGLDTVELNGYGFERISQIGAIVKIGEPLVRMDINKLKNMNKSIITPVIILNMDIVSEITICEGVKTAGKDDLMYARLKNR